MADLRNVILGMEQVVNETAELAAAVRCLAWANFEEGLPGIERAGLHRLASIVQERAESVLAVWHQLDEASRSVSPPAWGAARHA